MSRQQRLASAQQHRRIAMMHRLNLQYGRWWQIVQKHRTLYDAHLPEVMALLADELGRVSDTLERLYATPIARLALRVRSAVRG